MLSLRIDDDLWLELQDVSRVEEAFAVISANLEHINKWSNRKREDLTLEKAYEFWEKHALEEDFRADEIGFRIIYQSKIAGSIDFQKIDRENKSAEMGCWVAKEYNGRGFATRSATKMLEYGFEELKLNRIVVKCATQNAASRAVPEKLGFVAEGIEREALLLDSGFADFVVYSMLAREWKKAKGKK